MELKVTKGAETAPDSLRDRKKAATRKALQEAALRLFSRHGFGETSVDQIAAAAEVSRSTFFRYFGSKEAVLFAEMDKQGELFVRLLTARPQNEGLVVAFEEALVELTSANEQQNDREAARLMEHLFQHDPALNSLRSTELERWKNSIAVVFAQRKGNATAGEEEGLAAAVCMAVVDTIGRDWREGDTTYGVQEAIRSGFTSLRGLVGTEVDPALSA